MSPLLGHGCRGVPVPPNWLQPNLPNAELPPHHLCSPVVLMGFPVLTLTLRLGLVGLVPYSFTGSVLERAVLGEKGLGDGGVPAPEGL